MRTFNGIQAMRGVAGLSVALSHILIARFAYDAQPGFVNALTGILRTGVDLFFVISGFVISLAAAEIGKAEGRYGTLNFAFRRFARIYPLYWVVLATAVMSSYVIALQGWPDIPQTLTTGYIFLTVDWNWFVPQAWSLAFEVYFYLAVAIVLVLVPNRIIETLVVLLCVLVLLDLSPLPRAPDVYGHKPLTLEFGFGVFIAFLTTRNFARGWPVSLAMAVAFYAAGTYLDSSGQWINGYPRVATFGVGSALLIYSVVAAERSGASFPGWLLYLGDISYSLYIWHLLILAWLSSFGGLAWPDAVVMPVWLAVILAISAASYQWIERPVLRWARNAGRARQSVIVSH
jgi:exopolysaccharide production protein ExoZ